MALRKRVFSERDAVRLRVIRPAQVGPSHNEKFFYYGKVTFQRPQDPAHTTVTRPVFLRYFGEDEQAEQAAQRQMKMRKRLETLGLPVPKAGIVRIADPQNPRKRLVYLAVQSFLRKRTSQSRLIPINNSSKGIVPSANPNFLAKLTASKDKGVIQQLAKDLAKIVSFGLRIGTSLDIFGFYRQQDGSWKYVVMDVEDIYDAKKHVKSPEEMRLSNRNACNALFQQIIPVWPANRPEFKLFEKEFVKKLPPELKGFQLD